MDVESQSGTTAQAELRPKRVSEKQMKEGLLDSVLELFQETQKQSWTQFVGDSMEPHIKEGNMLLVQHALKPIRLGDVIVFKRAGSLIAHRVVFIKKHGNQFIYLTKGDNVYSFDAPVPQSSVLGPVIRIQKNNQEISLEKLHLKLFNFGLALVSYAIGISYQVLKFCRNIV